MREAMWGREVVMVGIVVVSWVRLLVWFRLVWLWNIELGQRTCSGEEALVMVKRRGYSWAIW